MAKKEIGFIGLGRMGANMVKRMLESKNLDVHVWNRSDGPAIEAEKLGAKKYDSVENLVSNLKQKKKIIWMMLPSGEITENMFQKVIKLLNKGDIIIDGANSNYLDTIRRHKEAEKLGIEMLDTGVSGGIVAVNTGYPMMIGGKKSTYEYCEVIYESFGYKEGYALVGEAGGSGHYVKMIHNAIEYGMMQAISEGFDLLKNGRFDNLDLLNISHIWNHGTIVESFLMKMTEQALQKDVNLDYLKPFVDDNGEGKWAAIEAMNNNVPFVVNTYALNARYISRDDNSFTFKMLAAQRAEFGGHPIKK